MNALLVCPEFPPHTIGGGGEVFGALLRYVTREGVHMDVLCGNYEGGSGAATRMGATIVQEVPLVSTPERTPYLRTTLPPTVTGFRRMRRTLDEGSYDVAHLHGVSFAFVDVPARMLARRRIPWVFTLHGAPRTPYRLPLSLRAAYTAYFHAYGSFVIRRAALRTSVSASARDYPAVAPLMRGALVIPNGIEADEYAAARPERAIAGWPREGRVLLSIGRLEPAKGFDTALRALATMREDGLAYVVLGQDCGMGPVLRRLAEELRVSDRFFMLGHADMEQKRFAFRRSEMLLLPSWNESFGLVALEAMAARLPVVASAVEGLCDLFAGELEDVLVPPKDPRALALRVRTLLADDGRAEALRERLTKRAGAFSWDGVAKQYVECYRDVLSA